MSEQKQEEIKAKLEVADLDENIRRIDYLLERSEEPGAHALGMKLALLMAKELHEKKAPGTDTAEVVVGWLDKYLESTVEEAIKFAREFLLKPQDIAQEVSKKLWEDEKSDNSENSDK